MPIWPGSRSIWTRSAGTVMRRQSVMTSVKRQPTASIASACMTADRPRAERACPRERGWRSSSKPLPLSVVTTGAPSRPASFSMAVPAPDQRAPPPAMTIGRLAPARSSAARAIASSGIVGAAGAGNSTGGPACGLAALIRSCGQKECCRSGPPGCHRLECPGHILGDVFDAANGAAPFCRRLKDSLEVDLAGNCHIRDRVSAALTWPEISRMGTVSAQHPATTAGGHWSQFGLRLWCRRCQTPVTRA